MVGADHGGGVGFARLGFLGAVRLCAPVPGPRAGLRRLVVRGNLAGAFRIGRRCGDRNGCARLVDGHGARVRSDRCGRPALVGATQRRPGRRADDRHGPPRRHHARLGRLRRCRRRHDRSEKRRQLARFPDRRPDPEPGRRRRERCGRAAAFRLRRLPAAAGVARRAGPRRGGRVGPGADLRRQRRPGPAELEIPLERLAVRRTGHLRRAEMVRRHAPGLRGQQALAAAIDPENPRQPARHSERRHRPARVLRRGPPRPTAVFAVDPQDHRARDPGRGRHSRRHVHRA